MGRSPERRPPRRAERAASLALAASLLVAGLAACGEGGDGPVPVAWDRQACARCRMLVSDPHYAAQLHAAGGTVYHFDDPGCLLLHRAEHPEIEVRATWYHHVREDRWVKGERVAFVPVDEPTPMAYGLGAVERSEAPPDALDPEAALEIVRRREAERQDPGGDVDGHGHRHTRPGGGEGEGR